MSNANPHPSNSNQGFAKSLLRHFAQYLSAIFHGWVASVSGVAGIVLLILVAYWGDEWHFLKDNKKTFVWTAVICLLFAGFSAWRKERQRWERAGGLETVTQTPREMCAVYKGRMTTHGERLAKAYKGRWMRITGNLKDISIDNDPLVWLRACLVNLGREDERDWESPMIMLYFSKRWARTLLAVQKGEEITVLGRIDRVRSGYISLNRCELIEVHVPKPSKNGD